VTEFQLNSTIAGCESVRVKSGLIYGNFCSRCVTSLLSYWFDSAAIKLERSKWHLKQGLVNALQTKKGTTEK
jgi:hypothetical protein